MKNQKGFSLLEVTIAIALLGIIAAGFLAALSTSFHTVFIADERATAESLARSQMECVKSEDYDYNDPQYEQTDVPSSDHPDYTISVNATPLHPTDDGIQKITVMVKHRDKLVITLEGYKVDR